jgi:hypothetical protein
LALKRFNVQRSGFRGSTVKRRKTVKEVQRFIGSGRRNEV